MKKMMFMMAVGMALAMQAANVNWTITNIKTPTDSTVAGSGYYVAMFCSEGTGDVFGSYEKVALATLTTALSKGDTSSVAKNVKNGTTNTGGAVSGVALSGVATTSAESGKFYAVIFDNADYTKATKYIVTSEIAKSVSKGAASGGSIAFGTQASATWNSMGGGAPEPTSGLLMLVGAGLLALRRKRN